MPHLFAKCVNIFGEPIIVPRHIDAEEQEHYRLLLENTLISMQKQADSMLK